MARISNVASPVRPVKKNETEVEPLGAETAAADFGLADGGLPSSLALQLGLAAGA